MGLIYPMVEAKFQPMAAKNDFTKWQRDESSTGTDTGVPKPVDLRWRASGRSLKRDVYNESQLEAQRDAVIFRWVIGIAGVLAVLAAVIYLANAKQ